MSCARKNISQNCVEAMGLSKSFGAKLALDKFTLAIERGGIHAVVGSNGAGKSTLFRLLLGVIAPTGGIATLLGEDSQRLSPEVRGRVGYVNEEHTMPGWLKAKHILEYQQRLYPGWNQEIYESVIGCFDVDPSQKISSLSRGERAGLNLALAFGQSPQLLILDEPTLGLDVVAKQSVIEAVMFTETAANTTIIYCSHQMDEIERVADRLIIMERGKLLNNSSPDDFVNRVSHWVAKYRFGVPGSEGLPGVLTAKTIGDQHHILVADQGPTFGDVLKLNGAVAATRSPVDLGRAVNAFLTKNHSLPETALDVTPGRN